MVRLSVIAAFLVALGGPAGAHGGGLDGLGCHHDRKAGGYHCHRGPLAGRSFASKADAEKAMAADKRGVVAIPTVPDPPAGDSGMVSPVAIVPLPSLPYDRRLYVHWVDADGDCQDARQEVLIAESLTPAELDSRGCKVIAGQWYDPYTGRTFTNPTQLDIDHLVPLAEAHRSGADRWSAVRRRAYANDLDFADTLIAVSAAANRSKGDKDPAQWMPPNEAYHCDYIRAWVAVKTRWELTMDDAEAAKVLSVQEHCAPREP